VELVSIQKVPFVQLQLLDEGLIKSLEHITNLGLGIQRCINVGFKAREERIVAAILVNRILHFLLQMLKVHRHLFFALGGRTDGLLLA